MRRMFALLVYLLALAHEGVRWPRLRSLALLGLLACGPSPAVSVPRPLHWPIPLPAQVDYPPMNIYSEWWAQVEGCSGYQGDMDRIRWTVANRSYLALLSDSTQMLLAVYRPKEEQIVVGLVWVAEPNVIRHEMLHALMDQNHLLHDDNQHPEIDFVEHCGFLLGHLPQ